VIRVTLAWQMGAALKPIAPRHRYVRKQPKSHITRRSRVFATTIRNRYEHNIGGRLTPRLPNGWQPPRVNRQRGSL
jgi:hypothetical protein